MAGAIDDVDHVTGTDLTGPDDTQIRPGPPFGCEPLDPARRLHPVDVHPALEDVAGNPDAGDLEHRTADTPALADNGLVEVEASGRQVLSEHAVADVATHACGPHVQVLASEGVDRLVDTAVVPRVGLVVAGQPERTDSNPAGRRPLVDRGDPERRRP